MVKLFTSPDAWIGLYYQLAIEYPVRSDEALHRALKTIWKHSNLNGCYMQDDLEPESQPRVNSENQPFNVNLYGIANMPNGKQTSCLTIALSDYGGRDLLHFSLPMGSLNKVYPVGTFPYEDKPDDFRRIKLDEWLVDIGRLIYEVSPFRLGLVGFQDCGCLCADNIATEGLPSERYETFLLPTQDGLTVHARNMGPSFTF